MHFAYASTSPSPQVLARQLGENFNRTLLDCGCRPSLPIHLMCLVGGKSELVTSLVSCGSNGSKSNSEQAQRV